MDARPVFHPSTLIITQSLLDIDVMPLERSKGSTMDIKSMKLKQGVEANMYGTTTHEKSPALQSLSGAPTSTAVLAKPADLLVRLQKTELIAVKPTANGWYAELTLGAEETITVDAFSSIVCAHVKKDHPELVFVSPLVDLLPHEIRSGAEAKLHAKVSPPTRRSAAGPKPAHPRLLPCRTSLNLSADVPRCTMSDPHVPTCQRTPPSKLLPPLPSLAS
jgi:hypothetical protein